jgi:hypothetical protein
MILNVDHMICDLRLGAKRMRHAIRDGRVLSREDMTALAENQDAWADHLESWERAARAEWGKNVVPFQPVLVAVGGFEQSEYG